MPGVPLPRQHRYPGHHPPARTGLRPRAYAFSGRANTYTITRNLATVAARADITTSWTVTPGSGQPFDWIGLVIAGDAPENYIATDGEGNTAWTYTNAVDPALLPSPHR